MEKKELEEMIKNKVIKMNDLFVDIHVKEFKDCQREIEKLEDNFRALKVALANY